MRATSKYTHQSVIYIAKNTNTNPTDRDLTSVSRNYKSQTLMLIDTDKKLNFSYNICKTKTFWSFFGAVVCDSVTCLFIIYTCENKYILT